METASEKNTNSQNYNNIKRKPIGVFDSGLGGLSAVKELIELMPNEDIIYFGDTGRVPYGNKSESTIIRYAKQDISFLLSKKVKWIIAACGTVSSVYKDADKLPIPFCGVLTSTSMKAVQATKNGKIGVIGTSTTIKSKAYEKEIKLLNHNINVFAEECPLFVPLVENGFIQENNKISMLAVEYYLEKIKKSGVDTLILGCTHYPLMSKLIANYMGNNVTLINSGRETALYARKMLKEQLLLNDKKEKGKCSYFVSDTVEEFKKIANIFLGEHLEHNVTQITIEDF